MPRLHDLKEKRAVMMMFYGPPGTGKTFQIGTLGSRWLIISNRAGLDTIRNKEYRKLYPDCNPHIEIVRTDKRVPADHNGGFNRVKQIISTYLSDPKLSAEIDGIVIDDFTFLRKNARMEAVAMNGESDRSKTKSQAQKFHNEVIPTIADFGTEQTLIESFLTIATDECREAGKHFIVMNHERLIYREIVTVGSDGKKYKENILWRIIPGFGGKEAPDAALNHFDLIAHMKAKQAGGKHNVEFQFASTSQPPIEAKDRSKAFQAFEQNLTLQQILTRYLANVTD
jgi:hypothetical protein